MRVGVVHENGGGGSSVGKHGGGVHHMRGGDGQEDGTAAVATVTSSPGDLGEVGGLSSGDLRGVGEESLGSHDWGGLGTGVVAAVAGGRPGLAGGGSGPGLAGGGSGPRVGSGVGALSGGSGVGGAVVLGSVRAVVVVLGRTLGLHLGELGVVGGLSSGNFGGVGKEAGRVHRGVAGIRAGGSGVPGGGGRSSVPRGSGVP